MTVIPPDMTRFRRTAAQHDFVVRELPGQPKPAQALGSTW